MNRNNDPGSKPQGRKRFYFLTIMVFLPAFFCLTMIGARWYGYLALALAFGLLVWIRNTPAWHGWHIPLCFVISLTVAVAGLYAARPRRDVSLIGQVGGALVHTFMRLPVDPTVRSGESFSDVTIWKPSAGYSHKVVQLPTSKLEIVSNINTNNGYAILQLHGGGFVSGMNDLYRLMAERYCRLSGGAVVFTLDYRLYPANPYPSQQNDAMDAWNYVTKTMGYAADRVLLAGDSAGGNLVLNLGLRLRDAGEALPVGMVAMSPWADLSNSGESHVRNATVDPSFGVDEDAYDGVSPVGVNNGYEKGLDARNAYLSPSFGDYAGFPPMLLQAGEIEVLLSDSQMVHDNAIQNGVDCTLTIYPGMFHVFQGSLELLPESQEAWKEIGEFVLRLFGGKALTD